MKYRDIPQDTIEQVRQMKLDGLTDKMVSTKLHIAQKHITRLKREYKMVDTTRERWSDWKKKAEQLLLTGMSVQDVANTLCMSYSTVSKIKVETIGRSRPVGNDEWIMLKNIPVPCGLTKDDISNKALTEICIAQIRGFRDDVYHMYRENGMESFYSAIKFARSPEMALYTMGQEDILEKWVRNYYEEKEKDPEPEKKRRGRKKN